MPVRAVAFLLAFPVAFVYRPKSGNFKSNQAYEMEGRLEGCETNSNGKEGFNYLKMKEAAEN